MTKHNLSRFISPILVSLGAVSSLPGQYPNIRIDNLQTPEPKEVTIAIDPLNPRHIAVGSNLHYFFSSSDGGSTWSHKILTSHFQVGGDPSLAFDTRGNLYYGHLSNYLLDRIVIQKSTDAGESWIGDVGVGYNPPRRCQDKEWIAVDVTHSRYRNNVYVAWTQFDSYLSSSAMDSSIILFSRSTDEGETWSIPVRVSDDAGDCLDSSNTVEGVAIAIGPSGEVYITWAGPLGVMLDKSINGGKTFGKDVMVGRPQGGWSFNVAGLQRCNGMPTIACDCSNSRWRGNIYVQWSGHEEGTTNTDIFISKSSDEGKTWSPARTVNDDSSSRPQFLPSLSLDPSNGNIYSIFYDRRKTVGDATEVYIAQLTDGGESFRNFKVSDYPFTPTANAFLGDYIGVAARDGIAYAAWTRLDGETLSIWISTIK